MNSWQRDTFAHPSHPMRPLSSSSRRRTINYIQCRTIALSTNGLCVTNTHSPSFLRSFTTWEGRMSTQNWMLGGDTTMYASNREMSGRQPSKHVEDFMNPRSCSLVSRSLPWWVLHGRGLLMSLGSDCPCCCFRGLASCHGFLVIMCYLVHSCWLCVMCHSLLLLPIYPIVPCSWGCTSMSYCLVLCVCVVMCASTYMVLR